MEGSPNRVAYIGPADNIEGALKRLYDHQGPVAIDTETINLKNRTCIGIGVAISPQEAFYFAAYAGDEPRYVAKAEANGHIASPYLSILKMALDKPSIIKGFFNAPFDVERLEQGRSPFSDLETLGISTEPNHDISVMLHVQGLPNSLEDCIGYLLCEDHQVISDILPKGKTMLDLPFPTVAWKCLNDCIGTLKLWYLIKADQWTRGGSGFSWKDLAGVTHYTTKEHLDCYFVDMDCQPILRKMEAKGIKLNQERLEAWYQSLNKERLELEDICTRYGFNPGSNQQVGYKLAERGNMLPFTKSNRQLQVDDRALKKAGDPLGLVVLQHRHTVKLLGTYITPWRGQDRAYTHFRLDLASGRLASFDRSMHQLPPNLRNILEPDTGTWTWADYSQIEMREWAFQNHDSVMLAAYQEGTSIHDITRRELWPNSTRYDSEGHDSVAYGRAKTFNFAMIYFAQDETLAENTGLPVEACGLASSKWKALYHEGWENANLRAQLNASQGYAPTDFGRYCYIDIGLRGWDHAVKCGVNYPDQGTCADIAKRGLIILDKGGYDLRLHLHDEWLNDGDTEFPPELSTLHPGGLVTPFETYKGPIWS